ncbi:MAG: SPOR domain-containing protein [Bacteroidota bacterium]|nr:SPOR domain-containing protein [Bacteroidota bacterium]
MPHRHFRTYFVLFLSVVILGACSSSEELESSGNAGQDDGSFQKVDREESIIPETDEPVEIEVVEDEAVSEAEAVPVRTQQDAAARQEKQAPAVQEVPPAPAPTPVPAPAVAPRSGAMMWSVQLGAFKSESGAFELVDELRKKFNQPVYKRYDAATGYYKVTLGSFQEREQAAAFKADVQSRGYPDAFTVEVAR